MGKMMKYMMYFSPIMMLFFFNNYASGLSLYYFISNLISIGIILVIKNYILDEDKIHAEMQEKKKKPKKQNKFQKKMAEMMEHEFPGQRFTFSQPIELRTNELISGVRSDVAIIIYGGDLPTLARLADEVVASVSRIPGAAERREMVQHNGARPGSDYVYSVDKAETGNGWG